MSESINNYFCHTKKIYTNKTGVGREIHWIVNDNHRDDAEGNKFVPNLNCKKSTLQTSSKSVSRDMVTKIFCFMVGLSLFEDCFGTGLG